jgi:outer membrane protein assembly factor BamB
MGERATTTAAGDGASVYQLTDSGKLLVLDDLGNSANRRSEVNYGIQPHGGVLITHGFLVFGGRQGNNEIIVISDRNGANLRTLQVGAPPVASPAQPPVVGGQMVFAASNILQAFDLFSGEEVWRYDEANVYRSPPLYVSPGVEAAAELYVTDGQGRVLAFDANTGVLLWTTPLGAEATSLAANNTSLFATGAGFVRGLTRQRRNEGQIIWNVPIPGSMPGGPVVDDSRILVVTEGGGYQFLDAASGSPYPGGVQSPALGGAVAVSGPWVFAPTQAGTIYAARDLSQ